MTEMPPPSPTPKSRRKAGDSAAHSPALPQGDQRPVWPRFLRGALAVSVALNLLIAGIVLGTIYHKNSPNSRVEMTRELGFGPFAAALSGPDRHALRAWLQQRAPQLRSANAQRARDMQALQAALRADPFDPQAMTAALQTMRARQEGQLALGHEALGAVILAMPAAERMAFADRLARGLRRADQGRGGPDHGQAEGRARD